VSPLSLLAGKLIVEANTYGNMTFTNPEHYNPGACEASAEGCMLWKQVTVLTLLAVLV
jgi:hypothetical protein